ncbi:MAG: hypothetical protein ABDI07_07525 [Candidatus Kryptonium sp.]
MKIMNSAFIYVPVISKYNVIVDNVNGIHTTELNAGAIWYRVVYKENGEGDLTLVVKKETRGIGVARIGKEFKHENEKVDHKSYAFRTAVVALARDLQIATRDIPEFRLGAQVVEVYSNAVSFPMGKREGLKIDDGFDLVELQENPNGGIVQKKVGFVRVVKVADNVSNPRIFSRAQIIIGSGIEPGIYVSERPRLPVDIYVKIESNPFTLTWPDFSGAVEKSMNSYSIHGELVYNIGRNVNISQLWAGAGIFIGGGDAENLEGLKYIFGDKPDVSVWGLNGILIKKFYFFRRFSAFGRAELSFENITFSKNDVELKHSGFGLGTKIGVEYVMTPDLNLGLSLGYRIFSKSEEWNFEGTYRNIPGLAGDHSGVVFSLYLNYSLPKLGFDPIAAIRGGLGW